MTGVEGGIVVSGVKRVLQGGWGAVERGFFGFLPCQKGLGGGFLCLFLRFFALEGGVFLRRSARFFIFLRGSFLKGAFFLI